MIFTVQCPDPDCEHEFTIEKTDAMLADDDDLTTCPECRTQWESVYDEDEKTLELIDQDEDLDFDDEQDGQFSDDEEDED